MIVDMFGKKIKKMTQPTTDLRFDLAAKRGDLREAMGWSFVHRLEKLVNELLEKPDCPALFWVIYSAKWAEKERKVKEMWQVTDERPKMMMGQIVYEIDKSGKAECWAMPLDIPVPEEYLSDEIVTENVYLPNAPLSTQTFEKI
jgi:hypothetical protein